MTCSAEVSCTILQDHGHIQQGLQELFWGGKISTFD